MKSALKLRESHCLLLQDNVQQGGVDVKTAVAVFNEAEFPKFIHEEIHPAARCHDHFRQRPLRYFGKHILRLVLHAIATEQQKRAGQPFLAGVKELINRILLDSNVPRKHISQEAVGELLLSMENTNHFLFFQ